MASSYDMSDLESWDARIRAKVAEFGLDCYPQEFEICDHHEMLAYMAYSGVPSHYPHWSYGKGFEKLKTMYDHGVSGLPYEMVINSNPALAYLMRDNSLLLQVLTIAHVYGHNDFFKNNFTFRSTRAEFSVGRFKAHATRIRAYLEDPSIGVEKVEPILDAAHALSLQCQRNLAIRKPPPGEQRQSALRAAAPPGDPFQNIHRRADYVPPDLKKVPLVPDEDLLLFVRDHNPYLDDWERDLLTIVDEEARYFIPQIETKIMNEGWATYWHREILRALDLPQDMHMEFLVRHNQVARPFPGGLNPYYLGLRIWEDIRRRYDETPDDEREEDLASPGADGRTMIFEIRESDRDTAFLRRHLTPELMRDLDVFRYRRRNDDLVIDRVSDDDGWRQVKETLIANVGPNQIPVIRVDDADFGGQRTLHLVHAHDGRDLQMEYAEKTLAYLHRLWQHEVALETVRDDSNTLLIYNDKGFSTRSPQ